MFVYIHKGVLAIEIRFDAKDSRDVLALRRPMSENLANSMPPYRRLARRLHDRRVDVV